MTTRSDRRRWDSAAFPWEAVRPAEKDPRDGRADRSPFATWERSLNDEAELPARLSHPEAARQVVGYYSWRSATPKDNRPTSNARGPVVSDGVISGYRGVVATSDAKPPPRLFGRAAPLPRQDRSPRRSIP